MGDQISRRKLLRRSAQLSLGGISVALFSPASAVDKVCADVDKMESGPASMRESLHYVEVAPDQSMNCSACGFFVAAEGGCGTCAVFNGGPVNSKGHCDSWGAKD